VPPSMLAGLGFALALWCMSGVGDDEQMESSEDETHVGPVVGGRARALQGGRQWTRVRPNGAADAKTILGSLVQF
jgi:hypothetical protein